MEKEKSIANFKVNGFKIISITFGFVIILSFLLLGLVGNPLLTMFDLFVLLVVFFLFLLLVFFPILYKKLRLGDLSIWTIQFSSLLAVLSYIPLVDFRGTWFLVENPDTKDLNTIKKVLTFLKSHWFEYLIIYPGIFSVTARVFAIIRDAVFVPIDVYLSGILQLYISIGKIILLVVPPLLFLLYFTLIWVWEDANVMIASIDPTSGEKQQSEIRRLWSASSGMKALIGLIVSFSAIIWLVDAVLVFNIPNPTLFDFVYIWIVDITLFSTHLGVVILLSIMYYRSGIHEEFVNNLRRFILRKNQESTEYPIKIGERITLRLIDSQYRSEKVSQDIN
ncbi:MAG: hypothetical protein ACFFC7_27510 [Candidatus Hermodarchaeota archaeon]